MAERIILMAKIEYYIRGNFNGKGIEKVNGYQFDIGNPPQTFYYTKDDAGKYMVTIPCNGMKLGEFDRLKDAKKFIAENMDKIVTKLSSNVYIEAEKRFLEMVDEAEGRMMI